MKMYGIVAIAAGALMLAACGGGSSHAECKDEASATAYAQKWAADLQAAAVAGKIDPQKAAEASQKMMADAGKMDPKDVGAACKKLDEIRAKIGF